MAMCFRSLQAQGVVVIQRWKLILLIVINNFVLLGLVAVLVYFLVSYLVARAATPGTVIIPSGPSGTNLGDFVITGSTLASPRADAKMQLTGAAQVGLQSAANCDVDITAPGTASTFWC